MPARPAKPDASRMHSTFCRIASQDKFDTLISVREALASLGLTQRTQDVQSVLDAQQSMRSARRYRYARRAEARLGYRPAYDFALLNLSPARRILPSLRERLDLLRQNAVLSTARALFRHDAAGGHSMSVRFVTAAADVDYRVTLTSNWTTYAVAYKGWKANEDHHQIGIPLDWRVRVERAGLATLGGMMTLDAHRLESAGDIHLFAATWAGQGRGFSVTVQRGVIAVRGNMHYHAETLADAIEGITRKSKAAQRFDAYAASTDAFIKRYRTYHCEVHLDDARNTGSCEYGIRAWCARVGLNYDTGSAPLAVVLEGFRRYPQTEVRRAVLHDVRRARGLTDTGECRERHPQQGGA